MFETPKNKNGMDSMQHIQYLGALNTYYKRYLYLNAFGITDGEVIDSMNNNEITNKKVDNMSSIMNLIKTKKVNETDFLKYFGVDRVGALTYDQQQQALVMLEKK
jgi:DeoR/GlpR family transcriptional regulator of sugar metabolism